MLYPRANCVAVLSKQCCRWYARLSNSNTRNQLDPLTNNHGLPVSRALQPVEGRRIRQRQPLESLTPARKAVASNPYANALASPVRQCNFTAVRLPSHYFLPFTTLFRRHDHDKLVPYLAPADPSQQTSRAYIFNSRRLLSRLRSKKTWQRLLGHELKFGLKNRNDYRWPDQIDATILAQLRQVAIRKLAWIMSKPNAKLVVPCNLPNESPASACILYLRNDTQSHTQAGSGVTEYHLPELLGQEALQQLIQGTSFADLDALILQQSYMTISAHLALARLSTFLSSADRVSGTFKKS